MVSIKKIKLAAEVGDKGKEENGITGPTGDNISIGGDVLVAVRPILVTETVVVGCSVNRKKDQLTAEVLMEEKKKMLLTSVEIKNVDLCVMLVAVEIWVAVTKGATESTKIVKLRWAAEESAEVAVANVKIYVLIRIS